ncbi:phage tail protein [Pantoea sp. DY-15]|uniref:phage tail-collar fiber domain-containing protein n=1 Tax=Pantoea sp. DY-15 TaxID=2871489 RepID=UPI001C978456|nr:phage tail protein [Pantoea sp. DY-15]MBY4887669.1 phage tail protein [Pantoea sp. DY-15]
MTTKYFALLTNQGAAKLANAAALGTKVDLKEMAVGDGGGTLPTPDPAQTKLIGEKRRAQLNSLSIDAANSSQIIAEQIIPESEGGFWIREIGLYDADGVLIAVANCAETYKPQLAEGSGRTQTVRMILIVNSTSAVTLKIDPSVVLATRKYVDDGVIVAKQYADTLLEQAKKYADDQLALHLKAGNPHAQYLQIAKSLAEIKDAGKVVEALKSLGIGEGAPLIGSPFPWPHAQMPNELFVSMSDMVFLKTNGASFSGTLYPKLALPYPGLKLPDLRGEFIRGWDDGRGIDSGRALLTLQTDALQRITGTLEMGNGIGLMTSPHASTGGAFGEGPSRDSTPATQLKSGFAVSFDSANVTRSATETRPRNVAFNYLVRAA